ncbi:prepilin peptidase [Lysinimonas soli]|uniref:Prepilin leader peptidase/N-methyltransferase n=1 Tax=Lysinimonas soli TaxID=1074233 RepID=A0ABW0NRP1_9MICO
MMILAASLLIAFVGITGLAIGSFLNVVVYRVPAGMSVVRPRSACPNCGHEITARDNVPVLSWLLLGGKCRSCAERISKRYPLVELAGAAAFVLVAIWAAPTLSTATDVTTAIAAVLRLVAFLYLAAISVALAIIDIETHRLPNVIVLPGYGVGIVLLGVAALLQGDIAGLIRMAAGAAILFAFYLLLAIISPRGMGMGDVKLAGVLGLFLGSLGWGQLAVGAGAAFVLGGLFGVVLMVMKRAGRKSGIPFGPWMLLGAWIGVFAGQAIAGGYLALVGLL